MFWKKNKAACAVLLSAVLYFAVHPYRDGFIGGLLASGCLAALVGGLADWFAVSALFRRPLGIAWRTEVIRRNRERLFTELVRFIAEDLLSIDNIKRIISRYPLSDLLLDFFEKSSGKEKVGSLIVTFLEELQENFMDEKTEESIRGLVKAAGKDTAAEAVYFRMLALVKAKRYDDRVIDLLVGRLMILIRDERIKGMFTVFMEEVKAAYEGDSSRRKVMGFMVNLSAEHLADLTQEQAIKYLAELRQGGHPHRALLKTWLYEKAEARSMLEKIACIQEQFDLGEKIIAYVKEKYSGGDRPMTQFFAARAESAIENKVGELKMNDELKSKIDQKMKVWLGYLLSHHHVLVRRMIEARLRTFSDDELVAFIEDKVADDLQMIRINGSFVGALAGMTLYLVSFAAERMWR